MADRAQGTSRGDRVCRVGGSDALVPSLLFISLVVAAVGSVGAPLITTVATSYHVSLSAAQWTLTVSLLSGAVATPVLGRLGAGPGRRQTIVGALVVVVTGSVVTVLPLPFAWLLAGRAGQGVGLALTALMMGVARDHLDERRSTATIALISVTSTIGVGVGYPLAGLLADLGGLRAAYGLGLAVSMPALVAGWRHVPEPPSGRSITFDMAGAVLLTGGLSTLLIVVSETGLWSRHLVVAVVLSGVAAALLAVWAAYEARAVAPLVDVRLLRHRRVAGANLAMLVGGAGMYLLLSLITRYVQTPPSGGYGFGLSTFAAGLVLVPFSALGFVAGRLTPPLRSALGANRVLAGSAGVVLVGFVLFASDRGHIGVVLTAMGVLGFGVGSFSSAMPAVILSVTPRSETSSAMSFNGVLRSVGFSLGSALGGLILGAATGAGRSFPRDSGYTLAAWIGVAAMAATAIVGLLVGRDEPGGETGAG